MQEKWKLTEIWQKGTFMRSCAKIFTRNGSKRRLKAVMQKYSQEITGKHCFREVVLKYSCPATQRGRIPEKKYYSGWCGNIHFKINIHSWIVFHKTNYLCTEFIYRNWTKVPFFILHLIAGLVPRTSSSLAPGLLQSWVWLTIGSSFLGAQLACFEPISLVFFSWSSNMSNSVQLQ